MKTLAQFPQGNILAGLRTFGFLSLLALFLSCNASYTIKKGKTGKFEIGEAWPPVDAFFWKGMEVVDTTFEEGGYIWGVQVLRNQKGQVLIEEDFFYKGRINRIRVEHPRWKAGKDMHQGQTFGEIKKYFSEGAATYLVDYQMLDLVEKEGSGIHFLFKVNNPKLWEGKEKIDPATIPDSLVISSIVVM